MVTQVGGGLAEVHGAEREAHRDPLVEGGEGAHAQPAGEGGLAHQDAGEGAARVEVGVGEQAQLLELVGGQQMRLVDDQDDAPVALGLLGGEQVGGLGDELGLGVARDTAERGDDGRVEAPGAEGAVADLCG